MTTLVVGDVQGCADELDHLLDAAGFASDSDRLVFCGDLVNRGAKSLAVVRTAWRLDADLVLGNHDLHLLAVAAGLRRSRRDTFHDVLAADDRDEILGWLVDRPEPLVRLREYVVVHAGLPPGFRLPGDAKEANERVRNAWTADRPLRARVRSILADPAVRFLTRARYCDERGHVPANEDAVDPRGFRPWFEHRTPGPRIAFGHWARLDPARAKRADLRFLDTGCVYGGRLTGWLVEADRLVSVPARRAYWRGS